MNIMKIQPTDKQTEIFKLIIDLLKKKSYSIAELSRKLKMNRTTLIYYLNLLKEQKAVRFERIERKFAGRPTKIIHTPKEQKKKFFEKLEEEQKDFETRHKQEMIKILGHIHSGIEEKNLLRKIADDLTFPISAGMLVSSLYWRDLIKKKITLTDKGKQFLKENKV